MKSLRGSLFIVAGTVFWGLSAVLAKILFNKELGDSFHIDPLILVQTRVSFSCLVMFAFFLLVDRSTLRIDARDIYRFVLLGIIGIAGSNFTYYFTIQQINVSTAILMQYTAPLLVLAYATISKEESLSVIKVLAALLSIVGCFLAVGGGELSLSRLGGLGFISGFGSAVCWAFTNVYVRHLLRTYSVWTILTYSFFVASVFWLFVNPPWTIVRLHYAPEMWLQFFGFALISVLIPHIFYFTGVRYVTASRAIITGTFEPIVAITSSFLILGEILSTMQVLGAVTVIAAIALLQLKREEAEIVHHVEATELK